VSARRAVVLPLTALGVGLAATGATWLAWRISGQADAGAALAVLVLATPVGMVLATGLPSWLTRRVGRGLGVRRIGSRAVGRWHQVPTMVLDPFRSLTTGQLVVTEVRAVDADHERNLRWFAGALAHSYDDPVGRAVAKLAGRGRLTNVAQEPGLGIRGSVDRHPVRVGQPQWLGLGVDAAPVRVGTTVAVEVDQRPLGQITVADEVRPDAARQLDRLRRAGLTPVLASARPADDLERLARLSASPAWHAETDPLQLARELSVEGCPVGLVQSEADGTATLLVVGSPDCTPAVDSEDSLELSAPTIDTVVHAVVLASRSYRAERRAVRLAWLLLVLPLPFAALGLVPPVAALVLAACTWIAVALAASREFLGIRMTVEPDVEE